MQFMDNNAIYGQYTLPQQNANNLNNSFDGAIQLNSNFNQGAWMGANNKVAPSTSEIVTA